MRKSLEIRIGRDFARDMGELVEHPEKLAKEPDHTIYIKNIEMLESLVSKRKLNLLKFIINNKKLTVNLIARKLKRKQEAISRDLRTLQFYGLIKTKKVGRNVYPEATCKKIIINLAD
ncbi:MAG: hypothetical protein ABH821_03940 [archaeon]